MTIALRQRPLARVVAGIVRANDGAIFDASDMSTMFQDAAGTIPVTAVELASGVAFPTISISTDGVTTLTGSDITKVQVFVDAEPFAVFGLLNLTRKEIA